MSNIREKISTLLPEAVIEDGDIMQVTVPDAKWHDFAKTLRDDADLSFDFLVTIVGMDWKENGMGCVYYLTSTKFNTHLAVKVMATGDRERPLIHSIFDLWAIATIYEREVYDFFGIIFINNPDMRRLFLNLDWKGYPLRKDYDEDHSINPVSIETNARLTSPTSGPRLPTEKSKSTSAASSSRKTSWSTSARSTRQLTVCFVSALQLTARPSRRSISTSAISTAELKRYARS